MAELPTGTVTFLCTDVEGSTRLWEEHPEATIAALAFILSWRGAARTAFVALQTPWLLSGGMGGIALLGTGIGSWCIHLSRLADARHQLAFAAMSREILDVSTRAAALARHS